MVMVNRDTNEEKELNYSKSVMFLYKNFFGRIILKMINNRFISNIVSKYMNSKFSKRRIDKAISEYKIDMSLFEDKEYCSYNDFFTRKKKNIDIDMNNNHFISPCDSKLMVLELNKNVNFNIKGSKYDLKNIIEDDKALEYQNGYALIFRLEVNDYHRYHYIDNGKREEYKFINGKLNTVQPIAYDKNIFHTNCREWTVLHTENFDDVIEIEVGALLIGKISNNKQVKFKKGDEKGYFEFGGSTIILFVKDNIIKIDDDILNNSLSGKETIVHCGEKIGIKK